MDFIIIHADWTQYRTSIQSIRKIVFIQEQGVSQALEWDGLDDKALHLLTFEKHTQKPIATARLLLNGRIGRMAVLPEWRKRGIADAMLKNLEALALEKEIKTLHLHAQSWISKFYQSRDYLAKGKTFMEAGIEHVSMYKNL